ncbi:MAG: PIN domain-containing protein [Candidatus Woesearchaeota archaeon]
MSFDYVIDSYAWIEYYIGSKIGLRIKKTIETGNIATPILVIAELSDKFARENKDFDEFFKFINSRSTILNINVETAIKSGQLKLEMRKKFKQFGLSDAIIYLSARINSTRLLTGDTHLKDLEDVEFIE